MIEVIRELIERDMAYVVEGNGVYFRVTALPDYGALVHRDADELREGAGARVEVDERKDDPLDFALWKAAKPGEPTWDSPWGPGRPGWHIECVAMSLGILGEGFDIHGGGDDLVFPHHENERAEAVGAGKAFARTWVHNGMVQVEGEKMSKSLGNFTTLAQALDNYDPRAIRLLVLQTHYRKTMEINGPALDHAERALDRLDALARRYPLDSSAPLDGEAVTDFNDAVDDDLATPSGVAVIFETVRRANAAIDAGDDDAARSLVATVHALAGALGLDLRADRGDVDGDAEIDALVAARTAARASKDFAEADRIRDELTARGIVVEDTAAGPVWRRA
jgi:cysteinyl-tRNA synthetase